MDQSVIGPDKGARLKTKGVEAVDKALKILSLFDSRTTELTLGEISARTGLVKSSVLRLMVSLQNAGYVVLTQDKRYAVGVEAFRVGRIYQQTFNLEAVVRPVLKDMVRATGESGSFFRREGRKRVCVFREDTDQLLREHIAEGDAVEIGKGAAGHVFVKCERISGDRIATAEELALLPEIAIGERAPGIAGLSVPVFSLDAGMIGALTLSGPMIRFDADRIETMKPVLLRAGARITHALRGRFYDGMALD